MASETAISDHTSATDELQEVEKKLNEEEEKPKVGESPSPATASSKPEQAPEDKRIGPPLVEVENTDDAPAYSTEEKDFISHSHSPAVPEPVADTIETQSEEQTAMESVIKEAPKQVAIALLEKGPEEEPKIVDVPEPIAEAPVQKLIKTLDVLPANDSESVAIDVDEPEVAALEADENLGEEQSELDEQVEKANEEVEIKESVETAADKNPRTWVEKVENTTLLKEVQTGEKEEAGVLRNSEQAQSDLKEDGMDFSLPVTVTEQVNDPEDKEKLSGADVVGEQLSEKAAVEIGNLSEENVARTGDQTEVVNEKKNEVLEESTLPVEVEDVDSFPSTTEVNEKSMEGDNISRDVEVAIKGNKGDQRQNVKDGILALAETNKDDRAEEKQQAEVTTVVSKPLKEAKEPELQLRSEETVETSEDKLEKGKVDEIAKCDVQNLEPSVQESKLRVRSGETVETSDDKLEKGKADEIATCHFQNLEPSVQEPEFPVRSEESVETGEDKLVKGKVDEIAKADVQNLEPSVGQEPELHVKSEESVEAGEDNLEKAKVVGIAKPDVQKLEPSVQKPELHVRSEESVGTDEDKLEKGEVEIAKADVQNLETSAQEPKFLVRSEEESVETGEDKLELKGKVNEIAKANVQNLEPFTLESELQVRSEESVETGEEKREKGEVVEIAKANVQNQEPTINVGDETNISQDQTKEHPTKSTPKQSNNIISKVKQSLAKAKKAIIGKSPNSKTLSSETKGDIKV